MNKEVIIEYIKLFLFIFGLITYYIFFLYINTYQRYLFAFISLYFVLNLFPVIDKISSQNKRRKVIKYSKNKIRKQKML